LKKQLIYLVRHGETEANRNDIYQGWRVNLPLNSKGKAQAHRLGRFLEKHGKQIGAIYTSPAKRAKNTAAIVAEHIAKPKTVSEIIIEKNLYEIDHGDWCGHMAEEVRKLWPKTAMEWWHGDQSKVKFPGGESIPNARKRIINAFENIIAKTPDKNILIVAHGGTNSIFISHLMGTKIFRPIKQDNTCLNIIERKFNEEVSTYKIKILLINGVFHLLR